MTQRVLNAAMIAGSRASRLLAADRTRRPANVRQKFVRYLPVALLAMLLQVLAPVAASALTAATIVTVDPFGGTAICHAETDAAPSNGDTDRAACGLDCVMCCVLHAAAALDAPPAPFDAAPLRLTASIVWTARELRLVHLLARAQAQPRGPPFLS
ncbi:DUF2946 family protein [Bradyrhizobium sp. HKCCYLRH2060]|uniref:DUF2946 family protein n=1 Tax=Bradyrhizobium TaxID=374 RepID=UPI002916E45E|nr:DUF2946 family protein [Bradyrhizobium sp. SZCCHNR3003]